MDMKCPDDCSCLSNGHHLIIWYWQSHLLYLRCPDTLLDSRKPGDDTTQLALTLRMTQIAGTLILFPSLVPVTNIIFIIFSGVVPLTYGILLHNQVSCKYQSQASIPVEASKFTLAVAEVSISLLNHVALVDLQMLQVRLLYYFFSSFLSILMCLPRLSFYGYL